ncbi:MFS transporter [Streptomyces sp. NPDC005890]|uniref:MFS transporter n=1 Tax=Streptomyces sp. NPDC005890 TaxID=3154568 RepID=UPI0033D7407F
MRSVIQRGPVGAMVAANLVNALGTGLYQTVSAMYLTRSVGLTPAQVGLGISLGAAAAVVAGPPLGHVADRRGPRNLLVLTFLVQCVGSVCLTLVNGFAVFLAVSVLTGVSLAGTRGAQGALIAQLVPADRRARTRAVMRGTANVGLAVGAMTAGLGLVADSRPWYVGLILGDAATFVLAALTTLRIPPVAPANGPRVGPRLAALRDRPFLAFTALDGLMSMHFYLLELALPLWVATATSAPRWMVSVLFCINTASVLLLQVRATKGTETPVGGARAARRAGLAIGLACVLFALAGGRSVRLAVVLLALGAMAHVAGELWQSAAGWSISFGLAPAHAHGEYQATYSTGLSMSRIFAPAVLAVLVTGWGVRGWLVLGAVFVSAGLLISPVVRWAARSRDTDPDLEVSATHA